MSDYTGKKFGFHEPPRTVSEIPKAPEEKRFVSNLDDLRRVANGSPDIPGDMMNVQPASLGAASDGLTASERKLIESLSARIRELHAVVESCAETNIRKRGFVLQAQNARRIAEGKPMVNPEPELSEMRHRFTTTKAAMAVIAADVAVSMRPIFERLAKEVSQRLENFIQNSHGGAKLLGRNYVPGDAEKSLARLANCLQRFAKTGIGAGGDPKNILRELGADLK